MLQRIFGTVVARGTGNPISGLKVEVVADVSNIDESFGSTRTDKDGIFDLQFDDDALDEQLLDVSPLIRLKIFNLYGEVVYSTEKSKFRKPCKIGPLSIAIPDYLIGSPSVVTERIRRKEGGRIVHPHGLTLSVSPCSMSTDACVEIRRTEFDAGEDDDLPGLGDAFSIYASAPLNVTIQLPVPLPTSSGMRTQSETRSFFVKIKEDNRTTSIPASVTNSIKESNTDFVLEASFKLPGKKAVAVIGSIAEESLLLEKVFHPVPHYFKNYELGRDDDGNCRRQGSNNCNVSQRVYPACVPTAIARLCGSYQLLLPPDQRRWYVGTPTNPDPNPDEHGDHFTTTSASMAAVAGTYAVYPEARGTDDAIDFEEMNFPIGEVRFTISKTDYDNEYRAILDGGVADARLVNIFSENDLDLENGAQIFQVIDTDSMWYINDDARSQSYMMEYRNSALQVYLCDSYPIEEAIRERAHRINSYLKNQVGGALASPQLGKPVYIHHKWHSWNIVGVDKDGYWSHGQSPTEALSAWTTWSNAPWFNIHLKQRYYGNYVVKYPKHCELKPVEKRLGSISIVGSGGASNLIQFVDLPSGTSIDWTPNKFASTAEIGYVWIEDGSPLDIDGVPTDVPARLWDDELGYRIPVPAYEFGQCSCDSETGCSQCRLRLHLPFWVHNTTLDQALTYKVDLYFWNASGRWVNCDATSMEQPFPALPGRYHQDKYELPGPLPGEPFVIAATPNTTPVASISASDHPLNWQPVLWRIDFHKDQLKEWNTHGIKLVLTCVNNCLVQDIVQLWFRMQKSKHATEAELPNKVWDPHAKSAFTGQ